MKFLRYIQKKRRAMLALATLTFFASPLSAHASNITTKAGVTLKPTDNVYNIEVQKKLSSSVGVNKFKDFSLDKGHIANLQFDKLQTLANLVDNRISINGTVNALRDGKIGGNLYFLSPNGIAVGSSGVINAGAFTGLAVDEDYFDKLSKIESGSEFMTALAPKNIQYNNDPEKGIDIQGVINAPGGIHLYATKIDVGKDAILRTDVEGIDFTKVVNVENVDSGITGGLDASYKNGDIVLKAHAEHVADDNVIKSISGDSATQWEKITEREATINVDGTIKSAGDVSINAESVTTFSEGSYFNVISQTGILDAFLGSIGLDCSVDFAKKTNTATVNIGKTADIYSAGNMDIGAASTLSVTINATTPAAKTGTTSATDWIPATSVAVISATNKATVNIDGKLESKGTMAINANATTSLSATANTSTSVNKSYGDKGVKEDTHYIAVSLIDGETKAEVNINSGDEIKVGGKDSKDTKAFSATATTDNTISNSATAATKATSIGSTATTSNDDIATTTAVNITLYDVKANVNVNRAITAENGGINLDATNTFSNSLSASTVTGRSVKPMENWSEVSGPEFLNAFSNNLMAKATAKLQKAAQFVPEGAGGSTLSSLFNGEYFKTGVTVAVFDQNNDAKINLKNNAVLNAKNDIDISATNKITKLAFNATSNVNNKTSAQETDLMIGLGVLVSDITNNADIVNDGKLTSTGGNVNLKTTAGMNYNQFEALVKSVKKAFTDIAEDAKKLGGDVGNTFSDYESQVNEELDKLDKTEDPAEYMQNLDNLNKKINDTKASGFDAAVKALDDTVKLKKDLENLPSKLTAFLHPSSYTNYYARSSFGSGSSGDKDIKLEAAGSFSINSMLNNSRIVVGDNSVITAENGAVNTNSLAQNRVVAITGIGGEHLTSAKAQNNGVGISVFVGDFQNNAVTAFGKNSQIKSKDIRLETKDYSKHVNIIYGNGKADTTSVTGMVSFIKSPANSIIALDDSTKLNGSGDVKLNALSENYITSVDGGITLGNGSGKSFGAAINILNNDGTTAVMVADNGVNSKIKDTIDKLQKDIEAEAEKDSPDQNILIDKKTELKALKIAKTTQNILGEDYTKELGDSSADTGEIIANTFNTTAENTGVINTIAVEGTENSESHGLADKFNNIVSKGEAQLSYVENAFKWPATKLSKTLGNKVNDKFKKSGQNNAQQAANQAGNAAGNENGGAGANAGVDEQQAQNQLNIAGAGSAAINIKSGETGSLISNSKITANNINVSANDDAFHGSWAGAGAFNFFGNSQAAKNTNVAIGGAVAYNDNSKNVDAIIKNSTINNATSVKNSATRDDSDVSAGMGLAVSTNSGEQGTNVDVAISASINFIEGDTHALLLGVREKGNGVSIENKAVIDSLQVAGGLDIAGSSSGGKGFNIGGSAAASKITNDLQSGIKGGSYQNLGKVDITANKKSNQIDVAVAGGITTGAKGFSFGGAVAVSEIDNNSRAFLNDTSKFNSTGIVNIDALDTKNTNSRNEYLSSRSINTDPTSFLNDSDKGKIDGTNGGGNIVNVALGGGASTSDAGAGGLGISYAEISNLMKVDISNNEAIGAQNLNVNSNNDSNIVNVTLGLAGSNKSFSAAGSFGVNDIKNDGTITISNSNATADNFLSNAQSNAHIVNVAGQAALANKFSGGLTFAYNAMNNTTGINVSGGNWNAKNFGANSTNNNYAFAIGAGVAFSKDTGALNGAIGLNMGNNSTKSIIDGSTLSGIENLKAIATDKTSKTTIGGDITISSGGKVAAGGAIAYADIGTPENKEIINAKVTNATITTKNNSNIDVEALDNATMTTVGVGAGGSISNGKLTFQGAAAVSELNKENVAEISNSTITSDPDIKIIATSGGNSSDGLSISGSSIDVNNKVKTAAAVFDANFSSESWFDGVYAITVNNLNQSTEANFKNTSRPETVSNVGNVDIFSNSEADILGVALGGAGGGSKISAAGSTSLNYINNSAKTLAENLNVKAAKNFGVVAQSDDKIANYAGAVDVDLNDYGSIGVSIAYNEIKGNTDALINNSKLDVTGSNSDLIAISNPKDNLIDGYVTRNNWTSGRLMSGRISENKSGLVVNSSATHSISSDLATIGIRVSADKPGVGISGTLNINKIGGATTSAIRNSELEIRNENAFVNASDYTNNGSFVGNAAISGTVAIGILWNENKIDRETNALVDGGTLNVKNLEVKADSRQGLSNLNIAVGAGFATSQQVFAAASGDNIVRNQLEGTTFAKIENATVNHSGAVNVNAYHKDNVYATNIAAGVAIDMSKVGATFDMGYGLMRENSTVNAEINNSTLNAISEVENEGSSEVATSLLRYSPNSLAVNVNAENNSKLAGAFGTAGVAAHVGDDGSVFSVAVGVNNNYVTNTVHAGIKGSTLNVGNVDVNARNTSEVKADGGVAAVALNISKTFFAALGASVAVTNATFDNKVTADVDSSTINSAGDVNITARDDHKSDETVVSAAASTGLAVSVNRMSTSINSGLANLNENQLGKTLSANDLKMKPDNPSKESSNSDSDKLTGEFGDETRFINSDNINKLLGGIHTDSSTTKQNISETLTKRYKATVNYNNSLKNGVFANVQNDSTINATNKISIGSTENNDLSITSGSGNAGIIGIGVGSTSIETRRANTANVIGSELTAKNIEISTSNGQTGSDGIKSKMYNATLAGIGVSVGYNNVETNGTGEILISKSKITAAENLNAKAIDNSKSESYILDAGLKIVGYTGVFAYNTNTAQTGIEISNESALTAQNINFDAQNHTYRATDTLAISGSVLNVQTSTSEAKDTSTNFINVTGADNSFTADKINFNALNGSQTYAHTNGQAYLGLNAVVAKGLAQTNSNANISIDDANTFKADSVNITAQIGEDGKYSAEATGFAINGSALGVNVDDMTAQTESTANITIGNETYGDATTLNISALNNASRNAFMRNNAYALVANVNDISAYTIAKDKSSVTVGNNSKLANSNKLGALNITADSANKSYVSAKGTGGALGGDFGSAAHADNAVDNTSSATLNGTWNIADDLTLTANQHDSAYISGYSARGAILTGGKGSLDNVIKGNSTAKISDGATINAKTVNVNSKNYIKTDKYSSDYDYTLFGRLGGVVDDVDYQRSTATTNKSANIKIGDSVGITTTGKQNYDALNDYNLKNDVYAEGGSLLVSLRWAKSHNYITTDENINVGKNATLKNEGGSYADGGITMAAHDNLELNPTAKGYSQAGFGGYVRAETLIELNRNPNITVDGTLKSAKDLNLYAGADINGDRSKVHSYARAISQVQTLISDGSADIIRKGATNANININSGAYGQAAHNVNIISNAGYEVYEERPFYGSTWSSDGGYKVVTSDKGNVTTNDYKHNNKVIVDGELKAANTPNATVNISGIALPDGFILTNSNFKNLSYSVTSGDVTITKKNTDFTGKTSEEIFAQQIYNGISTNTTDYANDYLLKRYDEITKLMGNYSGDAAAYSGLEQEKTALETEMLNLGIGSYSDTGEFKVGTSPSIEIKTVVLPDIEVSGGSINVSTNNFTGSGKLNASGIPKIDIQNNSSAYLITNRLTIGDKGGSINYNDTAVASNSAINNLNASKSGANFSDLKTASVTEIPTINLSNNYAGSGAIPMKPDPNAKDYGTLPNEAKTTTLNYTPINFIEVTKDIQNPVGNVKIKNTQGSIRILSGANVSGMNVEMTAKDSISQGYTDGIVNIAYTPENRYASAVAKLRADTGWDKKMPEGNQSITAKYDTMATDGGGRIAGEAIYIAARDININGLIQSGYNGYKASITQSDIDNATETAFFNGVTMYKVNNGGEKEDANGYKYYEPQIYYDKDNEKLYVEDIKSAGGKVYLAGRIMSTGNGKIVVADGTGDIDIRNASTVDMKIGNVTSASGEAIIQIVDTAQDKLTEYSSGKTRTIENYSAWLADNTKGKATTGDGLTVGKFIQYKPKAGLSYNWGEGVRQEKTDHYYYKEELSWWGGSGDSNYTSDLAEMSAKLSPSWSEPVKAETLDIGNGIYISDSTATSGYITMLAQNIVTNKSYGNHTTEGPNKHGFFGFYRNYDHRWTQTTGTKQIYQYAVRADYPISVGIIGKDEPTINLFNTSTAGGDLYLSGNIRNDNAKLNIRAQGGDIIQEGVTVSTDNINLSARNHIKNIDITNHRTDSLDLTAQSTSNAGNIDINVQGGVRDNQYLNGSVVVNALTSKNGEVSLTAQGNIRQATDATSINARNIKLESKNGYINLQIESDGKAAFSNNVSAISAAANGDITLIKNDDADFRVGSIVSTTGDVTLTAQDKFIDALDKERDNASTDENELVKSWIDMGLIAGTADYKGAYVTRLEKDRDDYKSDITEQFSEYKTLLATYQSALADYNSLEDKSKVTAPTKSDRLELLEKKFSKYETADAYLAADKDYQTLVATAANPVYQWTEEDLLNGIRSAIVNKTDGSAPDVTKIKDANITGRNVTLTGAGVGTNSKEVTTVKLSDTIRKEGETEEQSKARLEALNKLANAEAVDVTIHYVTGDDGKPITHTVERVNYRYDADKGYYIDTAGNYIRYRKDADGNLLKYTYDANLNQIGSAVAVSDFSDVIKDTTTFENKEIDSFDIKGTIPLGINATGNINIKATSNDGVYIAGRNKGVKIDTATNPNNNDYSALNIVSVETTKSDGNFADVRIIGEKGIFNANTDATAANIIGKDLVLIAGNGAIGTQDKPLTVTLTGDLLNARSNDEINLKKIGADDFRISAMYSPKDIRITNDEHGTILRSLRFDEIAESYINTPASITFTGSAGKANTPMYILQHASTILNLTPNSYLLTPNFYIRGVNDGTITLNDISGNIDISSEGSIGQTATGTNNLTSIKVAAAGDILLTGKNKLTSVNVEKVGGNFELNNDSDKVTVTFNDKVTGELKITQRNAIELAGSIEAKSIDITSKEGSLKSIGGLKTTLTADSSIALSATDLEHMGQVITEKLTLATDKDAIFPNTQNTFSELTVSSRDGKAIAGTVNVATNADNFTADIKNDVTGDLTLTNTKDNGSLSFGEQDTINVGGNISLNTSSDMNYGSTVSAGKDIKIKAQNLYRKPNTAGYFGTTGNIELNVSNNIGTADSPILIGNNAGKSLGLDVYAGGGYLMGVNKGILTLGEIATDADLSISSEGSIAQVDGKKISVKRIEFAAADSIALENSGNTFKAIVLNNFNGAKATGSVSVENSLNDTLTVEGNLNAAGDVAIDTYKGLSLSGSIESDKNVDLTSGGDITSGKTSVTNAGEQLTMNAANSISFSGKASATKVVATMSKNLDLRNDDNAIDALEVGTGSNKNINGSVLVTTNADEFIALFQNNVVNDITLTNKKSKGFISLQDDNNDYLRTMNGSVTLDMDGSFLRGKPIWAKKDINITSRNGMIFVMNLSDEINNETLKAMKNVTLNAANTIAIDGKISAGNNLVAHSDKGAINMVGSVQATNDIELTTNEGNIMIGNDPEDYALIANGNVKIKTDNGIVTISGKTKSKKKIEITTNQIITNNAPGNVVELLSTSDAKKPGDITINAELEADNSIAIMTDDGDIEINKKISVSSGDLTIETTAGNIIINSNGAEDMVSVQNNFNIDALNGAIDIAGKVATQDGDITITSNHETYARRQKGITVEETGAINPGKNIYLNAINGNIEFKNISADNANIAAINGNVTAETISADDTIAIELEHGNLYLNLAQSKGVAILTDDSSESSVKTIRADSVDVSDAVKVGKILPYKSTPTIRTDTSSSTAASSFGYSNSNSYSNFANNSNVASNRNSYAILGSMYTNDGLTYWQNAISSAAPSYTFSEFASLTDDISHRQTRNYFEVRFAPTWLESEFMDIDYSFDHFGIRNATEDELTID